MKRLFTSPAKSQEISKTEELEEVEEQQKPVEGMTFSKILGSTTHSFSFGEVYANELAKAEIEKDKPKFPIGSIIVREKNLTATSETPELVIAMVKREKGFSEKTGDWEFFTFDGKDLQMKQRETVGNCAECHSNAKQTDWVFREYLKK